MRTADYLGEMEIMAIYEVDDGLCLGSPGRLRRHGSRYTICDKQLNRFYPSLCRLAVQATSTNTHERRHPTEAILIGQPTGSYCSPFGPHPS